MAARALILETQLLERNLVSARRLDAALAQSDKEFTDEALRLAEGTQGTT